MDEHASLSLEPQFATKRNRANYESGAEKHDEQSEAKGLAHEDMPEVGLSANLPFDNCKATHEVICRSREMLSDDTSFPAASLQQVRVFGRACQRSVDL